MALLILSSQSLLIINDSKYAYKTIYHTAHKESFTIQN